MAATINLCFLFAIAMIGLALVSLVVWPILGALHIKQKGRGLAIAGLAYVGVIAGAFLWATRPAARFQEHFGFAPTADIQNLTGSYFVLGDTGETELSFSASRETVDRIVAHTFGRVLPDAEKSNPQIHHFRRDFSEAFSSESYELWFDDLTGEVRFEWVGID
ncbi:MAG: hypothetical protein H8E37_01670 [Planctomycetes bacterium]|nr:hypothetical protein [Planctomycetota bacterium]